MDPSDVQVYPVALVDRVNPATEATAWSAPPHFNISASAEAVTVPKTVPVSINSHLIPAAAVLPSKETPQATTFVRLNGLICKSVLIEAPVVTGNCAAVVGIGPLNILYRGKMHLLSY
jgi:hypothetical protein